MSDVPHSWFGQANHHAYESLPPAEVEHAKEIIRKATSIEELPTRAEIEDTFFSVDGAALDELWRFPQNDPVKNIYEVYTEEYVQALAENLAATLNTDGSEGVINVLEVGAGSGKLSYHLQRYLEQLYPGRFNVESADIINSQDTALTMPATNYKTALEKVQPRCVISSWMPIGQDWTPDFRATESVDLYILIGTSVTATAEAWASINDVPEGFKLVYKDLGRQYTSHDGPDSDIEDPSATAFFIREQ